MNVIRFGKSVLSGVFQRPEPMSTQPKGYRKPRVTLAPLISYTPPVVVGSLLTYEAGTWLNFTSIIHTWQVDGQFVQFSGPTYTVTADDVGKVVTVLETATNASGGASSRSAGVLVP